MRAFCFLSNPRRTVEKMEDRKCPLYSRPTGRITSESKCLVKGATKSFHNVFIFLTFRFFLFYLFIRAETAKVLE